MEITEGQYQRIAPRNAILYLADPGCKWRGLPESFGPWHTVYMRWRPWNERRYCPGLCRTARSWGCRRKLGRR